MGLKYLIMRVREYSTTVDNKDKGRVSKILYGCSVYFFFSKLMLKTNRVNPTCFKEARRPNFLCFEYKNYVMRIFYSGT